MYLFFKKHSNLKAGFSLVELLVSIGIMTAIITVVVFNQRTYSDASNLSNTADVMSLSIAEAQAYGLAVKETSPGSVDFSAGYGISVSLLDDGSENGYVFFVDHNNSGHYDGDWSCSGGALSECFAKEEFAGGARISSFCVLRTQGADQCSTVSRVDVSFQRPNPDAGMVFFNAGGNIYSTPNLKGVSITLESDSGAERSVIIYTTGQVSVE